jgi:hypothetical protein
MALLNLARTLALTLTFSVMVNPLSSWIATAEGRVVPEVEHAKRLATHARTQICLSIAERIMSSSSDDMVHPAPTRSTT